MRFIKIIALTLAVALLLGGCSLVRVDEEKVAEQVVARVNDTEIYRYEISEDQVYSYVQQMVSFMQQMGQTITQEQIDEMVVEQRETMLQESVNAQVLIQKAAELGITLTEEENAQNLVDAQDYLDNISDLFVGQVEQEFAEAETEAEDMADQADAEEDAEAAEPEEEPTDPAVLAEAEVRFQAYLEENNISLESLHEEYNTQDIMTKVRDYMIGFAEVTDEQVRTWYDQTLAIQQEEMDAASGPFEELIRDNKIYTYVPQGVVAVRDVLIAFDETLSSDLEAAYTGDMESQYEALISAATSENSDSVSTATDIKARLDSGELMEDIVEELSADMENLSETTSPDGYVIDPRTQQYSDAFVKAATGLEAIGDVSAPFADYDGVHVLQLVKVYEPGVVSFDELKDSIKAALVPGAEEEKYNEMLDQWVEEADVKLYMDRLHAFND